MHCTSLCFTRQPYMCVAEGMEYIYILYIGYGLLRMGMPELVWWRAFLEDWDSEVIHNTD